MQPKPFGAARDLQEKAERKLLRWCNWKKAIVHLATQFPSLRYQRGTKKGQLEVWGKC